MMTYERSLRRASAVVGLLGLLSLTMLSAAGGCNAAPRGNTRGTVDPYRSTPADETDRAANSASLLEFSDNAADAIARRIASVCKSFDTKALIEMGDLENQTDTPTSDFELIRRRMSSRLINSDIVREYAQINAAPERLSRQYDRFAPKNSPDGSQTYEGVNKYDPSKTFLLEGYFGEMVRGRGQQSTYFFQMTLTNLQSREVVFSEPFDLKQYR